MTDLTDDPRTPDEKLEDEAREIKDVPAELDPDAADLPEDVKTEPIDHGDSDGADPTDPDTHEGEPE